MWWFRCSWLLMHTINFWWEDGKLNIADEVQIKGQRWCRRSKAKESWDRQKGSKIRRSNKRLDLEIFKSSDPKKASKQMIWSNYTIGIVNRWMHPEIQFKDMIKYKEIRPILSIEEQKPSDQWSMAGQIWREESKSIHIKLNFKQMIWSRDLHQK